MRKLKSANESPQIALVKTIKRKEVNAKTVK
jgi:hypothetical protein